MADPEGRKEVREEGGIIMATFSRVETDAYLKYIGCDVSKHDEKLPSPSLDLLCDLMLAHVCAVPFENLSIHYDPSHAMKLDVHSLLDETLRYNRV